MDMNANLNDGFSGFELELEDFEVRKIGSSLNRLYSVGPGGSILSLPEIKDGVVFFCSMDQHVYALDCAGGGVKWKFRTGGNMAGNSTALNAEDDVVYAGNLAGSFYALGAKTGKEIWRFRAGSGVTTKPLFYRDRIFFPCLNGNVYCLDKDGRELWRFKTGGEIYYAPAGDDGKIYFGSYDGNFYCIDAGSGREIWRFRTGDEIQSEGPIHVHKGVAYFASMDNNLYAVDAKTGRELWRFKTGKYGNCCSPIIHDDVVYHGSRDGILYAVSLDGRELWRFKAGGLIGPGVSAQKNRIYFGCEDANLYCLDVNGNELWRFRTSGPIWNYPVVWKNSLLFGSWDCHFYCIDFSGKEKWRFQTSDKTISKVDPPYKVFEMVVKKSFEDANEKDDKYDINLGAKSEDRFYTAKSEYVGETTYATKKDYGQ